MELMNFAKTQDIDMIVLGIRGSTLRINFKDESFIGVLTALIGVQDFRG